MSVSQNIVVANTLEFPIVCDKRVTELCLVIGTYHYHNHHIGLIDSVLLLKKIQIIGTVKVNGTFLFHFVQCHVI